MTKKQLGGKRLTIYKLIDYDDGNDDSDLGIFESKLSKKEIKKIIKITTSIYSDETCDDHKTSIFEQLIKKGRYNLTNKTSPYVENIYSVKGVDKNFKWIKVKEINF